MDHSDLRDRIRKERVSADDLPYIFDEDQDISEEYRLKAIASIMRVDPAGARPYFHRIKADLIADAIEHNRADADTISLAVRAFSTNHRVLDAAVRSPRTPTHALIMATNKMSEVQLGPLIRDESRLVLAPDLLSTLASRQDLDELTRQRMKDLLAKVKRDKQYQIRSGFRPDELSEDERQILLEEVEETETVRENIYSKLMKMTAAEKALLALRANQTTRMILVRDPNPLVCKAVMRCPMLQDRDIERIAGIREVSDEVLRIIAGNRRWMQKYAILRNVALNPRTPIPISLGLLERLMNSDIKMSLRDHNLANAIKQAIKRIARTRGLK